MSLFLGIFSLIFSKKKENFSFNFLKIPEKIENHLLAVGFPVAVERFEECGGGDVGRLVDQACEGDARVCLHQRPEAGGDLGAEILLAKSDHQLQKAKTYYFCILMKFYGAFYV